MTTPSGAGVSASDRQAHADADTASCRGFDDHGAAQMGDQPLHQRQAPPFGILDAAQPNADKHL